MIRCRNAVLLVAYGVATLEGRRVLAQFDARVRLLFPTFSVRWAYSSPVVRNRLTRSGLKCDSVPKALLRMGFERFAGVVVQPLQTIAGTEHETLLAQVDEVVRSQPFNQSLSRSFNQSFNQSLNQSCNPSFPPFQALRVHVGTPLLNDQSDICKVASSLLAHLPEERGEAEDVIFMGHGSKHPASARYEELHAAVQEMDSHVYIGTMEGRVRLATIMPHLTSKRVWLLPLLATVGRHTLQDMAGSAKTSWRSQLEAQGFLCCPVLQGTVAYSSLADIWIEHLQQAAHSL